MRHSRLGKVRCGFVSGETGEGQLTKIKSVVVSRLTCARISTELKLDQCLLLGKGMAVHRTIPKSLMADVFESLVAAIYLDGGFLEAKKFIEAHSGKYIEEVVSGAGGENHKSVLQHFVQREFGRTPTYALLEEKEANREEDGHILFAT